MPYSRPTLREIDARLQADVESRLPGVDPALRRSLVGAIVRAVAGAHHEMYGYLAWIAEQAFPDRAGSEELARWAQIWGVSRIAAAAASGTVTVTGLDGAAIEAGTVWRTGAGQEYVSTARSVISSGSATVQVRARTAGAAGDAEAGQVLTLVSPISGVLAGATVVSIAGGADVEGDDSLRERLLARIQAPPAGGAARDYVAWALAGHSAVTRAWVRPRASGLGTVTVYAMTDGATPTGVPGQAVTSAIQSYIDARRPVTAVVTVVAPTAVPLALTIRSLTPDTTAIRAAIAAEIGDLLRRAGEPGGTIRISQIREAISGAEGETDHVLVTPTADVTHTAAQIATMGEITWQG